MTISLTFFVKIYERKVSMIYEEEKLDFTCKKKKFKCLRSKLFILHNYIYDHVYMLDIQTSNHDENKKF